MIDLQNNRNLLKEFNEYGYVILRDILLEEKIILLRDKFLKRYYPLFKDDVSNNRNILKRYADDLSVSRFFSDQRLEEVLNILGVSFPVYSGPICTHYTSKDSTGSSYKLPLHQDWTSMASSLNSKIVWFNLCNTSSSTHGIEVATGQHKKGIFKGVIDDSVYVIENTNNFKLDSLNINFGEVLIMSTFLPHCTKFNQNSNHWKLSISRRFDDMECLDWLNRNYVNSFRNHVERELFMKYIN
tara:strand:- start:246 stop:971 length:726 start_codon:yes stop_codon:yes gene_type:complete